MMPKQTINIDSSSVSAEEAQSELETVLHSPQFERSEKLQKFLRYVCELTLRGESSRLNEYLIGSEVFQRGANYSPTEDSVVRRQAHTLRQKLQEYYASEGRDHLVRIELPVGRYVPAFRRQHDEPAAAPDVQGSPEFPKRSLPGQWVVLAVVGSILLFVSGWVLGWKTTSRGNLSSTPKISPVAQEVWGNWLQTGTDAVICLSNPMTAVIKHFSTPLPPGSLPFRAKAPKDLDKLFRDTFKLSPGGSLYLSPAISKSNTGEAIGAVHLTAFFSKAGNEVRVTQSRFLSWEGLRRDNLIVLGHDEANQWVDALLRKYPMQLAKTSEDRPRSIINTKPAQGEPPSYRIAYSGNESEADQEYALISMLPGVEGNRRLLLISGLNTQATQIATEFLTTEATLEQLLSGLRKADPNHRGRWYFQAVLKTEVYDKVPTKASLVALRLL